MTNPLLEQERRRLAEVDRRRRLKEAWERSKHMYPGRSFKDSWHKPKPRLGRPRILTDQQIEWVRALVPVRGEHTIQKAAAELGVAVSTLHAIRAWRNAQLPDVK